LSGGISRFPGGNPRAGIRHRMQPLTLGTARPLLAALDQEAEARPPHLRQERVTATQAKRADKQGKAKR
jgi:hypothetical protein